MGVRKGMTSVTETADTMRHIRLARVHTAHLNSNNPLEGYATERERERERESERARESERVRERERAKE